MREGASVERKEGRGGKGVTDTNHEDVVESGRTVDGHAEAVVILHLCHAALEEVADGVEGVGVRKDSVELGVEELSLAGEVAVSRPRLLAVARTAALLSRRDARAWRRIVLDFGQELMILFERSMRKEENKGREGKNAPQRPHVRA